MRSTRLLVAAGFAFLAALPFRPSFADDAALARAIAGSELEARAAWEQRLPELLDAYEKDPQSPYAVAALRRIQSLIDEVRGAEDVERRLGPVLARGVRDGEVDEWLRDVLSSRAYMRGAWDEGRGYDADRGYLRAFATVGTFGWDDASLVHRRFGPEDAVLDPGQTWLGTRRRVAWTRLDPNPDSAWVDPWAQARMRNDAGVWYAVARVRSAGARPVALKVLCRESFKVFVNGREVVVADRERDIVPWQVWADASLVDGWNRILVKVSGRASFALKVCDPATGLPLDGLEEGDPLEGGPAPRPGADPSPRTYRTPIERVVAEGLADGAADAARLTVAADLAANDWRTWEAYRLHEKASAAVAAATVPGGAPSALAGNVRAWRGLALADFRPFPQVQRKLQAKQELAAATAAWPGHVQATIRLADYENEDDRPDKAVAALREVVAKDESSSAWMAIARIAKARGWDAEALDAARKAEAAQPFGAAPDFLADLDRRLGDHDEVVRRTRAALELDRNDADAAQALVGALRAQGRHEEALRLAQERAAAWPHDHGWRRQAADLLAVLGREDEALAEWRALAAKRPLDESLPRRIGEVLEVRGDADGALAAYRASLEIEPFQPNLWRVVTRLEGREEDFAAGWEPDVKELLAKLPSHEELKKEHPKAVAVTVLDHTVTKVLPDGSARSYVHMIYKVLDEKGVEKYGDLPNQGELISVRAILPDGTVMTPTGLRGQEYNVEGLVPGTVLDHRFAVSQPATRKGWDGGEFYFQDFEIDRNPNPVVLSRFVVLAPETMKLDPRPRNFKAEPKVETRDGWTATVWENRDAPIVEPERSRPENDEIFPLVDYSVPPDFDDAPWQLFAGRSDSRGSPMVDAAVAACVKPGMDDAAKVRAIYEWVNREITGDAGSGQGATAVLLEKAGDRGLLLEAMTRAAGVPARMGRALAWNGSGRDLADQDPDHFNGRFLWVEPRGGQPFPIFFPFAHHTPFGYVPAAFRGSVAFLLDESGGVITRLPEGGIEPDDSASFTITLGKDETSATVDGTLRFRSPNGYGFKRQLLDMAEDDRKKFAERQLAGWFANPKLERYELPRLADRGEPLDVRLVGTMSTYVAPQGGDYVVSLGFGETNMTQTYTDKAERQFDLIVNRRDHRVDEAEIRLGDAWEVKALPQDHLAVHDVGTYSLTWRHEGGVVRVRRERHFQPARYRPDEYKAFVAWCKAIDDAEDRKLELRKAR